MNINRNRLANVANPFQGPRKRVLCVCSAGLLRSPTVAWILSNEPFGYNTRAVGSSDEYALIPLDAAHVSWADEILVMDTSQADRVRYIMSIIEERIGEPVMTKIHVLDVPDDYGFRDPELVDILTRKLKAIYQVE